jgi:hypothetical protein
LSGSTCSNTRKNVKCVALMIIVLCVIRGTIFLVLSALMGTALKVLDAQLVQMSVRDAIMKLLALSVFRDTTLKNLAA